VDNRATFLTIRKSYDEGERKARIKFLAVSANPTWKYLYLTRDISYSLQRWRTHSIVNHEVSQYKTVKKNLL
jgi:hypothetical protein